VQNHVKLALKQSSFGMAVVSITRLRVRHWKYLPAFLIQALRSKYQAKSSPGSLAVSVLRDKDRAFWTRTVWTDETAMRAFMNSGVHRRGMPRLLEWCDEASVAHWVQDGTELPSWRDAYRGMREKGRRSRVNRPSEGQRRFEFPAPQTRA
jgi:hypothetical protein